MVTTLVLADDHPIILEGLEQLFGRHKDFQVVATCNTGDDAVEAVRSHKPDIVVLDVKMPNGDGLSVLKQIHDEHLATRVILLTASMKEDEVLQAMEAGVWGLVLKESAAVSLVDSVRKVTRGQRAPDQSPIVRARGRAGARPRGLRKAAETPSRRGTESETVGRGGRGDWSSVAAYLRNQSG